MATHDLKTVNPYFQAVWDQLKSFEVRHNDRDFKVDDQLILREYNSLTKHYSGRYITAKIIYILNDPAFCKENLVIIQLAEVRRIDAM